MYSNFMAQPTETKLKIFQAFFDNSPTRNSTHKKFKKLLKPQKKKSIPKNILKIVQKFTVTKSER